MNWEISKSPLVIAHRGDTMSQVENTLEAVESAMRLGVDGVEVDLQLTSDGEVVVFHDRDLKRLAQSDPIVAQTPLSILKKIRLKNGETIPTLEELLDLTQKRILVNLELKTESYFGNALEKRVSEKLKNFPDRSSLLVSSFNPFALHRMKRMNRDLKYGYLYENKPYLHRNLIALLDPFSVNAPLSSATPFWVNDTHRAKRRFLVWTVNRKSDIEKCVRLGVDGIITDRPRELTARTFINQG